MDIVDQPTRSRMMSGIRGRDTTPERLVRRYLHAAGLRFRLGGCGLPGRPDIVFPSWRVAVFVHGCFWHRHAGCRYTTTPTTRPDFWMSKFGANVTRDAQAIRKLDAIGWTSLIIWECETRCALLIDELAWKIIAAADGPPCVRGKPGQLGLA